MSRRNRSALAALVLGAVLVLSIATPATAAGLHASRSPTPGVLDRAWDWLAGLLLPDGASAFPQQASRWQKEGSAIDPNGGKTPSTPPPSTTATQVSGGPTLDGTK